MAMRKGRMRVFALIAAMTAAMTSAAQAEGSWQGLAGAALLKAVGDDCRPTTLVADLDRQWEHLRELDSDGSGMLIDRYSYDAWTRPADPRRVPDGLTWKAVTPWQWWGESRTQVPEGVLFDLHNIVICNAEAAFHHVDQSPGAVTRTVYTNGRWSAGYDNVGGEWVATYEPPVGYEGDFARIIMYMLAAYPCEGLRPIAYGYTVNSGDWPVLTQRAAKQLVEWHRGDPVDDAERARNQRVAAVQGRANPFVDDSMLAEYLWGEKSGQPYEAEPQRERTALKGEYSLRQDRWIDLYSPYAPEDAVWSIDGREVEGDSVATADVGVGLHVVSFRSATASGEVVVKIVE